MTNSAENSCAERGGAEEVVLATSNSKAVKRGIESGGSSCPSAVILDTVLAPQADDDIDPGDFIAIGRLG